MTLDLRFLAFWGCVELLQDHSVDDAGSMTTMMIIVVVIFIIAKTCTAYAISVQSWPTVEEPSATHRGYMQTP